MQYERIDGDLILVAAAGGAPEPPAWWRNLTAEPAVTVQLGSQTEAMLAIPVGAAERRDLWPALCERNRQLERVQRRAGRELPLVRLVDPAGEPHARSVLHPEATGFPAA